MRSEDTADPALFTRVVFQLSQLKTSQATSIL